MRQIVRHYLHTVEHLLGHSIPHHKIPLLALGSRNRNYTNARDKKKPSSEGCLDNLPHQSSSLPRLKHLFKLTLMRSITGIR